LILVARAERLDRAIATLARWANLPFDVRMLDALGPGLSQTLLVDAPVEAAVALAESGDTEFSQPYAVFSAGIASVEAGRQMFEKFGRKLEETSSGVWFTVDQSPVACGLAPALGRAQARVVCGARRVDVESLLPYATRGLPLLAMGTSDLHIELKLAPMRERYGQQLRQGKAIAIPMAMHALGIGDARLSRPISEALAAIGDEIVDVIDDLDSIAIDSKIASNTEQIEVTNAVRFSGARSWSAQTLADTQKHAMPAPTLFFELPKDAGMATFVVPPNPKSLDKMIHGVGSLLDGALSHINVNPKARDNLIHSMEQLNDAPTGPRVCAVAPAASPADTLGQRDKFAEMMTTWQICAIDQMLAAKLTAPMDAWVNVAADRAFRKFVGEKAVTLRRRATPAGLPAGTVAYEAKLDWELLGRSLQKLVPNSESALNAAKKAAAEATRPSHFVFIVVPDQARTWWGYGTDAKLVVSHLIQAKKSETDKSLGAYPELAQLRNEPVIGGGYFTVASFAAPFLRGLSGSLRSGQKKSHLGDVLTTAPHHGTTPIPFTWSVKGDAAAPQLLFTIGLGRSVIEDLASMGGQAAVDMAN
jgi:hypothetical protein